MGKRKVPENQAKIIMPHEEKAILDLLTTTRWPERDRAMFLLSMKAGLRAIEISGLKWSMLTDSSGNIVDCMSLPDAICKKGSGRKIPINSELKRALKQLKKVSNTDHVITSERGDKMKVQGVYEFFKRVFNRLALKDASSHSGRRTFATRILENGGDLNNLSELLGHNWLESTKPYLQGNEAIKKNMVELV